MGQLKRAGWSLCVLLHRERGLGGVCASFCTEKGGLGGAYSPLIRHNPPGYGKGSGRHSCWTKDPMNSSVALERRFYEFIPFDVYNVLSYLCS